jgi:8-oxo-dGTP pyrophosphatase MutT (NUDIX family)
MKKSVSCGVVITDGESLLIGHVTNGKWWDLPKGGVASGESFLQAAVRELREETGIEVDGAQLTPLGLFDYKPKKDLMLYLWRVEVMPDAKTLVCTSHFQDKRGRRLPELDAFQVTPWDHALSKVNPDMQRVLQKVKGTLS